MIDLCPSFKGATYEKIEKYGCVQWPCRDKSMEDKGTPYLHKDGISEQRIIKRCSMERTGIRLWSWKTTSIP